MNNPLSPIRPEYAVIYTVWFVSLEGAFDSAHDQVSILRMNKFHRLMRDVNSLRFKPEDAIKLIRPGYEATTHVPGPTADVGQALRFGQLLLALPEFLLGTFAVLDVGVCPVPSFDAPFCIPQRYATNQKP